MQKHKKLFMVLMVSLIVLLSCLYYFTKEDKISDKSNSENVVSDIQDVNDYKDAEDESPQYEIETEIEAEAIVVSDDTFVKVSTYIPDIIVELKYAGSDNFTKQKIYDFTDAYLRYGTVKKLMQVQDALRKDGLSLKIWDAFRPTSAQFILWEVCPDATYVANPNKGFSSHSRGNTVDITIVNENSEEILMPTQFDDFSELADREYSDCSEEVKANALLLENLMKENGFKAYSGEWWHFTDETNYPVEEEFEP